MKIFYVFLIKETKQKYVHGSSVCMSLQTFKAYRSIVTFLSKGERFLIIPRSTIIENCPEEYVRPTSKFRLAH